MLQCHTYIHIMWGPKGSVLVRHIVIVQAVVQQVPYLCKNFEDPHPEHILGVRPCINSSYIFEQGLHGANQNTY